MWNLEWSNEELKYPITIQDGNIRNLIYWENNAFTVGYIISGSSWGSYIKLP